MQFVLSLSLHCILHFECNLFSVFFLEITVWMQFILSLSLSLSPLHIIIWMQFVLSVSSLHIIFWMQFWFRVFVQTHSIFLVGSRLQCSLDFWKRWLSGSLLYIHKYFSICRSKSPNKHHSGRLLWQSTGCWSIRGNLRQHRRRQLLRGNERFGPVTTCPYRNGSATERFCSRTSCHRQTRLIEFIYKIGCN
jgi:hypothetical protein